jgi:hypothetical protein
MSFLKYFCPHFWKSKRELVFHNKLPYGHLTTQILDAGKVKRQWLKKAFNDYHNRLSQSEPFSPVSTAAKCLGIQQLMNTGFIIESHVDFGIKLSEDFSEIRVDCNDKTVLSFMDPGLLADHMTSPKGASKRIIRFTTPWHFSAPKDVVFLMLPVFYADDARFSVVPGVLDPLYSKDIHVMLWWFSEDYEEIKVHTPLAQLIPVPRNQCYSSWRMDDKVPEKRMQKIDALLSYSKRHKCPFYGKEFKQMAENLYDEQ